MDTLLQLPSIIYYFYLEIAIYLLLGLLVAGLLHLFFPDNFVRRHLGTGRFSSVFKSTLFAVPLPLCSCGVVPVASALKKGGANNGATAAFLTATPQIGADSFLMTYSLLGPVFAVFRVVAAFLTALLAGISINLLEGKKGESAVSPKRVETLLVKESFKARLRTLPSYIIFGVLGSIANTLLVGILIAGVITAFIPAWLFSQYLGHTWTAMFVMLLLGIPLYVCASASTPIAASMIFKGLSPGAGLVFLLAGPATNAVTIAAVARMMGKRAVAVYLVSIAVVALLLGWALDLWLLSHPLMNLREHYSHEMPYSMVVSRIGAVVLTLLFLYYYAQNWFFKKTIVKGESVVPYKIMIVSGMTCSHCAASVRKAVEGISGTSDISVDLASKKVQFILSDETKVVQVAAAIREAGFEV